MPKGKHQLGLFMEGKCTGSPSSGNSRELLTRLEKLDVTLLQKHGARADLRDGFAHEQKNLNFVGGIRGTAELEKLVNAAHTHARSACSRQASKTSLPDRRCRRHHAAQKHLVRAEAPRGRDVSAPDLIWHL